MDKIRITITKTKDKSYAVFHVNPMFASQAYWAGYHDLPRNEARVEVRPGDEEKLIAEVSAKVAAAEAAIAKHEKFMRLPEETRTLEVAGHLVTVHIKPWYYFSWHVEVSIPRAMKDEIDQPSLLGKNFDDEDGWETRDYSFTLSEIVKDKEKYFRRVETEMKKAAASINQLRSWRTQPSQHHELPGDVDVTIAPYDRWSRYEANVVAPKSLIDKAKLCGLKLGQRTWGSKDDHAQWWTPLRDEAEAARILAELRSEIEETLQTEVVAQYSI
jgi:hypothetical protein